MQWKDSITERTSAATNMILSTVLLGSSAYLATMVVSFPKARMWCVAYALVGLGTMLAIAGHGLELSQKAYRVIWSGIYLFLGEGFGFFGLCFAMNLWGQVVVCTYMPWVMAGSLVFILMSSIPKPLPFFPVALLSAVVLVFGVLSHVYLVISGSLLGSSYILAGLVTLSVSVIVQATRLVSFTLKWTFDHNSVYHLLNTAAYLMVLRGAQLSMAGVG